MGRFRLLVLVLGLPWALMMLTLCRLTQANESTTATLTEASVRALLEQTQEWVRGGHTSLIEVGDNSLVDATMNEIERVLDELEQKEQKLDRLVALANAKQVEELITRLNGTLSREITLRSLMTGRQISGNDDDVAVVEDDTQQHAKYVSRQEVHDQLNLQLLLASSEPEIVDWVNKIVDEQLDNYQKSVLNHIQSESVISTEGNGGGAVDSCVAVADVVNDVHVALTKFSQDGIGLVDHAQGAEIVHSMTSRTYVPPPADHELLGNIWWRKFIPEDWERMLPAGWEAWDVRLPSFLGAKTSPPETILEKKVIPSSCWPMDGSKGQVTIRLPYAIKVESFSLDHVASYIVPNEMFKTAPKKLKVIAYPPCLEPNECGALGFDVTDPMDVAHLEYDLDGPIVQTFDSVFVKPIAHADEDEDEELAAALGEEKGVTASCSKEAAACTAPPKIDVAGITVKVLENHGDPDYTCIYRFRVHGEQVL